MIYYSPVDPRGFLQTSLPPGDYVYSHQFVQNMNAMSPNYSIIIEPVFFDHLMMHKNKRIKVVTLNETLEGILTGIAIDHLQLTINGENYHIRYQHITYFKKA